MDEDHIIPRLPHLLDFANTPFSVPTFSNHRPYSQNFSQERIVVKSNAKQGIFRAVNKPVSSVIFEDSETMSLLSDKLLNCDSKSAHIIFSEDYYDLAAAEYLDFNKDINITLNFLKDNQLNSHENLFRKNNQLVTVDFSKTDTILRQNDAFDSYQTGSEHSGNSLIYELNTSNQSFTCLIEYGCGSGHAFCSATDHTKQEALGSKDLSINALHEKTRLNEKYCGNFQEDSSVLQYCTLNRDYLNNEIFVVNATTSSDNINRKILKHLILCIERHRYEKHIASRKRKFRDIGVQKNVNFGRVAAPLNDDTVQYESQTMEVELNESDNDSDSDPDDPPANSHGESHTTEVAQNNDIAATGTNEAISNAEVTESISVMLEQDTSDSVLHRSVDSDTDKTNDIQRSKIKGPSLNETEMPDEHSHHLINESIITKGSAIGKYNISNTSDEKSSSNSIHCMELDISTKHQPIKDEQEVIISVEQKTIITKEYDKTDLVDEQDESTEEATINIKQEETVTDGKDIAKTNESEEAVVDIEQNVEITDADQEAAIDAKQKAIIDAMEEHSSNEKEHSSNVEKAHFCNAEKGHSSNAEKEATTDVEKEATTDSEKEATTDAEKEATTDAEKEATTAAGQKVIVEPDKTELVDDKKKVVTESEQERKGNDKQETEATDKEETVDKKHEVTRGYEQETNVDVKQDGSISSEKGTIDSKEQEATETEEKKSNDEKITECKKEEITVEDKKASNTEGQELSTLEEEVATFEEQETIIEENENTAVDEQEAISVQEQEKTTVDEQEKNSAEEGIISASKQSEKDTTVDEKQDIEACEKQNTEAGDKQDIIVDKKQDRIVNVEHLEQEITSDAEKYKALVDGEKEISIDGKKELLTNSEKQALSSEEKEALPDGEKEALSDEEKGALSDGVKEALSDEEKESLSDGEKEALSDGENEALSDGEKDALSDGEEEEISKGEQESLINGEKEALSEREQEVSDGGKGLSTDDAKEPSVDGGKEPSVDEEKERSVVGEKEPSTDILKKSLASEDKDGQEAADEGQEENDGNQEKEENNGDQEQEEDDDDQEEQEGTAGGEKEGQEMTVDGEQEGIVDVEEEEHEVAIDGGTEVIADDELKGITEEEPELIESDKREATTTDGEKEGLGNEKLKIAAGSEEITEDDQEISGDEGDDVQRNVNIEDRKQVQDEKLVESIECKDETKETSLKENIKLVEETKELFDLGSQGPQESTTIKDIIKDEEERASGKQEDTATTHEDCMEEQTGTATECGFPAEKQSENSVSTENNGDIKITDADEERTEASVNLCEPKVSPLKKEGIKVSDSTAAIKKGLEIEVDDVETAVESVRPEEITDDSEEVIEDIIEAKAMSDAESSLKIADDTDHSEKMEHVIRMGSKTSEDSQPENVQNGDNDGSAKSIDVTNVSPRKLSNQIDTVGLCKDKIVDIHMESEENVLESVEQIPEEESKPGASGVGDEKPQEDQKPPSATPRRKRKRKAGSRARSVSKKDSHSASSGRGQSSKKSPVTGGAVSKKTLPLKNGQTSTSRTSSAESKKIPPIKAPVGNAPPPKVKNVKSKIGSLENIKHKPKGGDKKVETVKLDWNTSSKVGSLENATHKPGGGDKKILTQKLDFKDKVQSKVGSKDNLKHKPGGGTVKVETQKLEFKEKATSKVGSMDNVKHKAGGGNVKILSDKLNFKERAASKVNSLSGSEKGSTHGSETQSPVPPMSPTPIDAMPPVSENGEGAQDDNIPNDSGPDLTIENGKDDLSPEKPHDSAELSEAEHDEDKSPECS